MLGKNFFPVIQESKWEKISEHREELAWCLAAETREGSWIWVEAGETKERGADSVFVFLPALAPDQSLKHTAFPNTIEKEYKAWRKETGEFPEYRIA